MNLTLQPKFYSKDITYNNYQNDFHIDKVSFKGEDEKFNYEKRFQEKLDKSGRFVDFPLGKRSYMADKNIKAKEEQNDKFARAAQEDLDTKNNSQRALNLATKKLDSTFTNEDDVFNYDKELKKELSKRNWMQKFLGLGKRKAHQNVYRALFEFRCNEERKIIIKKALEKMELELENARLGGYSSNFHYPTPSEGRAYYKVMEELDKNIPGKGWNRIAGYKDQKEKLKTLFIKKILFEQHGVDFKMPNGILFYGPPSTGKTLFAKALAEQSGCNIDEIDIMQTNDEIMSDLVNSGHKSLENYKNSGNGKKRTILLLDELDSIARPYKDNKNSIDKLKFFLSNCSDKYKCTVVMTIINPRSIDPELLTDSRMQLKIPIGPPDRNDIAEIFKFYLKDVTEESINYNKLAKEVMKAKVSGQAYSPTRIMQIVEKTHFNAIATNQKVTENGLLSTIKKMQPNISKESLKKFAEDVINLSKKL